MKNRPDKTSRIIMSSFVVTMICFVFIALVLSFNLNWNETILGKDGMGNIGDFLSGTFGVVLGFVSFLLMWKTFSVQRKQFAMQDALQRQSSFETTFFNLLNSLDQVRENVISILSHSDKSIDSFTSWYKNMVCAFRESDDDVVIKSSFVTSQIEATEGVVAKIYEEFVEDEGYAGFYFRYVYNIMRFIIDFWPNYDLRRKYVDLLCARLSDEEMSLIFYNALSKYGLNQDEQPKFKEMLDKYQVFENLNKDYLIDRSHFRFYPYTDFKFLTRDERKEYLKYSNAMLNNLRGELLADPMNQFGRYEASAWKKLN